MKKRLHPLIVLLVLSVLWILLTAFLVVDESRIEEVVTGIVAFAIMLFGPKPLKALYDLLKIPEGPSRVLATYIASGAVGAIALLVAGIFVGVVWDLETIMALAGVLAAAAQMAYHRLKDLQRI